MSGAEAEARNAPERRLQLSSTRTFNGVHRRLTLALAGSAIALAGAATGTTSGHGSSPATAGHAQAGGQSARLAQAAATVGPARPARWAGPAGSLAVIGSIAPAGSTGSAGTAGAAEATAGAAGPGGPARAAARASSGSPSMDALTAYATSRHHPLRHHVPLPRRPRHHRAHHHRARYHPAGHHPAGHHTPQHIARSLLSRFHWASWQFRYLKLLWDRESGWNRYASNPYSGAYGIPQAVPGSKMASAGADWRSSARTQIVWGMGYIQGRYGTPWQAWQHECQVGWY